MSKTASTKKPFRAIVKADLYMRSLSCISQEETRYYLTGSHIEACEKGGVMIVATDGHRLICLRDPNGFTEGHAIVRADPLFLVTAKKVMKSAKTLWLSPTSTIFLVIDGQRMGLIEGSAENEFVTPEKQAEAFELLASPSNRVHAVQWSDTLIDGTFPDWRRIIPRPESLSPGAPLGLINQKVLNPLVDALTSDGQTPTPRLTTQEGGGGPHLVRVQSREIDGFGIVMPMRASVESTLPEWFVPQPTKEELAAAAMAKEPKAEEPQAEQVPLPESAVEAKPDKKKRAPAKKATTRKKTAPKRTARRAAPVRKAPARKVAKKAAPKKAVKRRAR